MKEKNPQNENLAESRRKVARLQNRVEDLIENVGKDISCTYFFW